MIHTYIGILYDVLGIMVTGQIETHVFLEFMGDSNVCVFYCVVIPSILSLDYKSLDPNFTTC